MLRFQLQLKTQSMKLIKQPLGTSCNGVFYWVWMNKLKINLNHTDGYKIHLELLSKCFKSNGLQTVYTACIIEQCWYELKKINHGNKKLLIFANKHLFTISYVYFLIDLFNFATTYYRISRISLPLAVVRTKFKLIKEIVNEDEDIWMNGYQWMLNSSRGRPKLAQ